jgi:hypothetical protein
VPPPDPSLATAARGATGEREPSRDEPREQHDRHAEDVGGDIPAFDVARTDPGAVTITTITITGMATRTVTTTTKRRS